jgi:glycerol-3-phosphate O-acyltransferase/dihydroxyacetone phosphate acyltransferase
MRAFLSALFGWVLRIFFRRVEVQGEARAPSSGPVLFVLNHPNALIDPAFMLCFAPRPVSFLAKSTLFKMPVIGAIVRGFDCLPVYRQVDAGVDRARNQETFSQTRALLARGGSVALFPEGTSHSDPRLKPLKTGAARIALGAAALLDPAQGPLRIVPAGLFYTRKATFRSDALVLYGDPFVVSPSPLRDDFEPPREAVAALTAQIAAALEAVTLQADAVEALHLVERAERLFSDDDDDAPSERFSLRRRLLEGHRALQREHGARLLALERALDEFLKDCDTLHISPRHLEPGALQPGPWLRGALVHLVTFLALGWLGALGVLIHAAPYRMVDWLAHRYARGEDDMLSTLKILAALLLFPLTWALVAALCGWWGGPWGAALALALAPLSGWVALWLGERLRRGLGAALATRALLGRRREVERLRAARAALRAEILSLGELVPDAPSPGRGDHPGHPLHAVEGGVGVDDA